MSHYIITIARSYGAGGKQIGQMLSEKLGIPCYESQIPAMAAQFSGIRTERFTHIDEQLRMNALMHALKKAPPRDRTFFPENHAFVSDDQLFSLQARIIQKLSKQTSCIIVGKCANYLLRDNPNIFSVYVEAPRRFCVQNIRQRLGVSEAEAHQLIHRTDKYRADYYKHYTGGEDWSNPTAYDLVINTERLGYDKAVKTILAAAKIKLGVQMPQTDHAMTNREAELMMRAPNRAAFLHSKWFY